MKDIYIKLISLYESQMEEIDLEILELKEKIAELRKERKSIYFKKYYLENKKENVEQ